MNDADESTQLHAFDGYGIELEYMIVDAQTLSVRPIADRLLHEAAGRPCNDVDRGLLGWSNELVMHVIEVKNQQPTASLSLLPDAFQNEVRHIDELLAHHGARLMPSAMHPWMDPATEMRVWPHDNAAIYNTYERIFDTRSHGWANLQSMHINLPFANDREFARLHAAVRLVLPILPALAASSPVADRQVTGWADYRMHVYTHNADSFPSIAGMIVPETVTNETAYRQRILAPMYRAIAPHDTEHVLQQEWLNSRGAIARFDRNAIEIRVVDTQECPRADLAIAAAATSVIRTLYRAEHARLEDQQEVPTAALAHILQDCIRDADHGCIEDAYYLQLLGFPGRSCTARELWWHLIERMQRTDEEDVSMWSDALQTILDHGPLAQRILRALGPQPDDSALTTVYRKLCDCLHAGKMFLA